MKETRRGAGSRGMASAGLPHIQDGEAGDRMAELEARLARLEDAPGLRQRGRSFVNQVVPVEASHHFRNAGREQLMGIRSIVDFWIARIDMMEARAGSPASADRERIEID
jgi:hypothetical protein